MAALHTLIEGNDHDAVTRIFEITGYPRPILADENEIIIAIDRDPLDGGLLAVPDVVLGADE